MESLLARPEEKTIGRIARASAARVPQGGFAASRQRSAFSGQLSAVGVWLLALRAYARRSAQNRRGLQGFRCLTVRVRRSGGGTAAFARFAAGAGGTEVRGGTGTLGAMALTSGSFQATLAAVKAAAAALEPIQPAGGRPIAYRPRPRLAETP
jgi:hypothetical protein